MFVDRITKIKNMPVYYVYLEINSNDRCMIHVLDLPGCIARAMSREEALRKLPAAIQDYFAWLDSHGEWEPSLEEPIEIKVVEESIGPVPFDPGDAASLFLPDYKPLNQAELEYYFRLLTYSRADLLDLIRALPDEILDYQPDPGSFTIRRVLHHIGNAEEWYVSRLVPPETLPSEWEHDEALPIFEFLEMERRTAIERLRRLTEPELTDVFHPTHWTKHPEEAWTARKALRRFLEHEREHTSQVREILASYREGSGC